MSLFDVHLKLVFEGPKKIIFEAARAGQNGDLEWSVCQSSKVRLKLRALFGLLFGPHLGPLLEAKMSIWCGTVVQNQHLTKARF